MWGKLSDDFYDHPKVEALDDDLAAFAVDLWTRAHSYCGKHLTDGRVTVSKVNKLSHLPAMARAAGVTPVAVARELCRVRLWHELEGGAGFEFHEWTQRNPKRDDVLAYRQNEAERKASYRKRKAGVPSVPVVVPPSVPLGVPSGHLPDAGRGTKDQRVSDVCPVVPVVVPLSVPPDVRPESQTPPAHYPSRPVPSRPVPSLPSGELRARSREEHDPDLPPSVGAVLRFLETSKCLRSLARLAFADQVGTYTLELGGRLETADVLEALRRADDDEAATIAGGQLGTSPPRLPGRVMSFVARTARGEGAEAAARGTKTPPRSGNRQREPEPGPRYKTVAELEADQASKPRGPTAADRASLVAPPWKPKEPPPALDISALAGRKAL